MLRLRMPSTPGFVCAGFEKGACTRVLPSRQALEVSHARHGKSPRTHACSRKALERSDFAYEGVELDQRVEEIEDPLVCPHGASSSLAC